MAGAVGTCNACSQRDRYDTADSMTLRVRRGWLINATSGRHVEPLLISSEWICRLLFATHGLLPGLDHERNAPYLNLPLVSSFHHRLRTTTRDSTCTKASGISVIHPPRQCVNRINSRSNEEVHVCVCASVHACRDQDTLLTHALSLAGAGKSDNPTDPMRLCCRVKTPKMRWTSPNARASMSPAAPDDRRVLLRPAFSHSPLSPSAPISLRHPI